MKEKLKIFVAIFEDFAHNDGNPYVPTLEDAISAKYPEVEFCSEKEKFWSEDDWDIVHIMWPDVFAPRMKEGRDLQKRIQFLKKKGTAIVATVHNMDTHYMDAVRTQAYRIVYSEADMLIHLGSYSMEILKGQYPEAKHVLIPHHIYDTYYTQALPTKQEALRHFKRENGVYVLSFGAMRNASEKELILRAVKQCPDVFFVVPRFLDIPQGKVDKRWIKQRLKWIYYRLKYPNLIIRGGKFISDEELPMYYALTDITFIQRIDTLNSGNLPLGMYMGHVIVGPNVGNVGRILEETGNYAFEPNDTNSITRSLQAASEALMKSKGLENRQYAIQHWNTRLIADEYWEVYKLLIDNK